MKKSLKHLSIAATAAFSIVMFAFMKPILALLGASDNTYHYARQHAFCVIVLGGITTVLSNVMSNLLRSVGMSKEAGFGITMGGIINMALGLCTYQNEKDESVTAFLYSDIRDDGSMYMCAEIELNEAELCSNKSQIERVQPLSRSDIGCTLHTSGYR